jgi:hypothetical protein
LLVAVVGSERHAGFACVNDNGDPNNGSQCTNNPPNGCIGYAFVYPVGQAMYVDIDYASAYGGKPQSSACCVFRRVTSISDRYDKMVSLYQNALTFGPVRWQKSFTETYVATQTPNPNPSATPGTDDADGDGIESGWILSGDKDKAGDPAGYNNYGACSSYVQVGPVYHPFLGMIENAQVESATVTMPLSVPSLCP